MTGYARGKNALGICDRCSFTYKLDQLKYEDDNGSPNGLRVCPECMDEDQPQEWQGKIIVEDPQALYDPRPDTGEAASTRLFGWSPVGNSTTSTLNTAVGRVTVTIS